MLIYTIGTKLLYIERIIGIIEDYKMAKNM